MQLFFSAAAPPVKQQAFLTFYRTMLSCTRAFRSAPWCDRQWCWRHRSWCLRVFANWIDVCFPFLQVAGFGLLSWRSAFVAQGSNQAEESSRRVGVSWDSVICAEAKSSAHLAGHGAASSWAEVTPDEASKVLGRGLSVITELQAHSELEEPASPLSVDGLLRFAAGAMLGLALVAGTAGPARADVEASAGWPHSWSLISEAI